MSYYDWLKSTMSKQVCKIDMAYMREHGDYYKCPLCGRIELKDMLDGKESDKKGPDKRDKGE